MHPLRLAAAAALFALAASPAPAAIVETGFGARLGRLTNWNGPALGTGGHFTIRYDDAVTGTPDPVFPGFVNFTQPAGAELRFQSGLLDVTTSLDKIVLDRGGFIYDVRFTHNNAPVQFFGVEFSGSLVPRPTFVENATLPDGFTCCKIGSTFRGPNVGSYLDSRGVIFWTVTPLPSTLPLLGAGLAGLAAVARRRQSSQ